MSSKPVFLDGAQIGAAATWAEVARLLSDRLGRTMLPADAQRLGSESRCGFFVTSPCIAGVGA